MELAMAGGGETLFSTLKPGTHLRPHCGSTNGAHVPHGHHRAGRLHDTVAMSGVAGEASTGLDDLGA